jgi:integrase
MSKELRGSGFVYQQRYANGKLGRIWWISYRAKGVRKDGEYGSILFRESSQSTERNDAVKLLKRRLGEAAGGKPVMGAAPEALTLREMLDALVKRYEIDGNDGCARMARRARTHLCGYFGEHIRAIVIRSEKIDDYKDARQKSFVTRLEEGADGKPVRIKVHPANGTINREVACLRIAFNQMLETNRLTRDHIPVIKLLTEKHAVRKGFLDPEDFEQLHAALPADLQDAVRFLYVTSWRRGAMQSLEWCDLEPEFRSTDRKEIVGGQIHLPSEKSKTGHAQTLPLTDEVLEIVQRAWTKRDPKCPFVFQRDGQKIKSFRKAWRAACKAVGRRNLLVHDLRRSGIRNLVRAGVPESVAMGISGHRTRAMFARYDIASDEDKSNAFAAVSLYHQVRAAKGPKVVPIRKTA